MTRRISTIPSTPPLTTTHVFGDIATATRIESTAKTRSVSSTLTTVPQKADRPSHGRAGFTRWRSALLRPREEVLVRQIQQVQRAEQLHDRQLDQVDREQDGNDAERERADDAVAERLRCWSTRQPEHEHREHERVVGAEQPFEHDEQTNRQEVVELNVHAGRADDLRYLVRAFAVRVRFGLDPDLEASVPRGQLDTTRINAYI